MLDELEYIYIERGSAKGKALAVLTSGGDAPGMNATLRAIVRLGLYIGCKVYFIKEGFSGMVEGGENIAEANWLSVSSIIHNGGTIIGSARCKEFREYEGRLKAALHLVQRDISNLIVIGGDGSLTGAHIFYRDWPSLLKNLYDNDVISLEKMERHQVLKVVGIVASIDNDFCGTDMTIGTDSALHRIINAVDSIVSTAYSHQRVFILEIMGRRCGYLSIVGGIMSEADFVFIPESPPEEDWPDVLCSKLQLAREFGRRMNIIMVSEGATDCHGNVITAADIKRVIEERLNYDARITVLGHIQRGGNPSAFDRILGCRMGAAAVLALMHGKQHTEPTVVVLKGNQIVNVPLMESVENTLAVAEAMAKENWKLARSLRGVSFEQNWEVYKMLTRLKPPKEITLNGRCIAIVHVGAPACGLNAAVHSFVRNSICIGYKVFGINNGIQGLIEGEFEELGWPHVNGWVSEGGAKLGIKRTIPENSTYHLIAKQLKKFKIEGLLIIGGFEAFMTCHLLSEQRDNYIEFCIPMVVIPATISNNVPGTDYSLGADTALNEITDICDRIRQSAQGTKRRVFIIETMGGYCGYLATVAGMAGAADTSYIFEEKFSIKDLQADVYHMMHKMGQGVERGLILLNEKASDNYNIDFIFRLYAEEGKELFTCRKNIIGHIQQGGAPSPFDRIFGTKMASKCIHWFSQVFENSLQADGSILCRNKESACLLGMVKRHYIFTPVADLIKETVLEYRMPKLQWWLKLRPLARILGRIESTYDQLGTYMLT